MLNFNSTLLALIFQHLDLDSLIKLVSVNRKFHAKLSDPEFWKLLCGIKSNFAVDTSSNLKCNIKLYYELGLYKVLCTIKPKYYPKTIYPSWQLENLDHVDPFRWAFIVYYGVYDMRPYETFDNQVKLAEIKIIDYYGKEVIFPPLPEVGENPCDGNERDIWIREPIYRVMPNRYETIQNFKRDRIDYYGVSITYLESSRCIDWIIVPSYGQEDKEKQMQWLGDFMRSLKDISDVTKVTSCRIESCDDIPVEWKMPGSYWSIVGKVTSEYLNSKYINTSLDARSYLFE